MLVGSLVRSFSESYCIELEFSGFAIHVGSENFLRKERKMRTNDEYIVNLVKQVVGNSTISGFKSLRTLQPDAWFLFLYHRIKAKVLKMNDETLGRICGYGHNKNFSEPINSSVGFIFKTGIEEVQSHPLDLNLSGRELLEEIAIRTIVAVTCDIVIQEAYEEIRRTEQGNEYQFDSVMAKYLHSGRRL